MDAIEHLAEAVLAAAGDGGLAEADPLGQDLAQRLLHRLAVEQAFQRVEACLGADRVDHLGAFGLEGLGDVPGDGLLVRDAEDEEGLSGGAEEGHRSGGLVDEGEGEADGQDGLAVERPSVHVTSSDSCVRLRPGVRSARAQMVSSVTSV